MLDLYNKLQRCQLYGIVLLVWVVILAVGPLWLRHFRFGPLEWLWRSLTCWKKLPLRITSRTESIKTSQPAGAPA